MLREVVFSASSTKLEYEIIVIDDGSTDATINLVQDFIVHFPQVQIRLIQIATNSGKGAALHLGLQEAKGKWLLIQDADLEYRPKHYRELLAPALDGEADVVYGSRFIGRLHNRKMLAWWQVLANKLVTHLHNIFSGLNLTDMETGHKLFRADLLKQFQLKESRFGFEAEVTMRLAKMPGLKFTEVPISYESRSFKDGKKIGWKDGFHALYCIFRYGLLS